MENQHMVETWKSGPLIRPAGSSGSAYRNHSCSKMKLFAHCLLVAIFLVSSDAFCIPEQVSNVTLFSNYSLSWSAADSNNCTIDNYVIEVLDDEENIAFQVQTLKSVLTYRFTFLDMCKSYTFKVHALTSEFVLGPSSSYTATTVPLSTANLTLSNVTMDTYEDQDEIEVVWELAHQEEVGRCVTSYRVVYWDERNVPIEQYIPTQNFSLKEEAACRNYSLILSAMIDNPGTEGPRVELVVPGHSKVPNVPTLVDLSTASDSVTMVWKLEPYSENLCTFFALNVNTLGAPVNETNLTVAISDNLLRPDVVVTLTDLAPNSVYTSYVNVENQVGTSKNVTISYQTLDTTQV